MKNFQTAFEAKQKGMIMSKLRKYGWISFIAGFVAFCLVSAFRHSLGPENWFFGWLIGALIGLIGLILIVISFLVSWP